MKTTLLLFCMLLAAACNRTPAGSSSDPGTLTLSKNEAALICGAEGIVLVQFIDTSATASTIRWRYLSPNGRERTGSGRVEERRSAGSADVDATNTDFYAGPYLMLWSPAKGNGSNLYYPPGTRVSKLAAKDFASTKLQSACR